MRLNHPEVADLQQGSIFNCVVAEHYDSCECWGIILNARCDLAHDKASVVSFLPVVKFADWSSRALVQLAAKRARNEAHAALAGQLLKKLGVTPQLINTFPWKEIIEREFRVNEHEALLSKLLQIETMDRAISLDGSFCPFSASIHSTAKKHCEKIITDLIQQKLSDYYFLNEVDVYSKSQHGYVVLLRHIHTISMQDAKLLCAGLTLEKLDEKSTLSRRLTFSHQPICMITGVLRSPDIEHLMQQFSSLFIRIGLEDQSNETITLHCQLAMG